MHQEASVAGQESAIFIAGRLYQLSIFGSGIVGDVDTEEAQVAGKFSKVNVSDKLLDTAHLQSIFWKNWGARFVRWINIDLNILG